MEIQILYQQGKSLKEISRLTGYSINTIRKYTRYCLVPSYKKRSSVVSKLDPYKSYIKKRVYAALPIWLPAIVIEREIVSQGYTGKISLLRYYLRTLKPEIQESPIIRYETAPGEQMQVDWCEIQRKKERICAFVAVLGYSRISYVEFVANEKLATLIKCHENAFEFFGGVPENILYDNMRTVIVERDAYGAGKHRLQSGFWDFAKHYNFIPKICRPYRPQTKGKVERFIRYLRGSFYNPLLTKLKGEGLAINLELVNLEVKKWLQNVANCRVHGTTKKVPISIFQEDEQQYLQVLPVTYCGVKAPHFDEDYIPNWEKSVVNPNCNIQHPLSVYEQFMLKGGIA